MEFGKGCLFLGVTGRLVLERARALHWTSVYIYIYELEEQAKYKLAILIILY